MPETRDLEAWIREMWDLCPIDGSRDEDIKIHGLPDYVVRKHHEMEDDEEDLFELDSSDED